MHEKLTTTQDQTGKLIECRGERGKDDIEERKSARGTAGRKKEEKQGMGLEHFSFGHFVRN